MTPGRSGRSEFLRGACRRRDGKPALHVLMIDANNDVASDRRVWLQCLALRDDGYDVSVICPGRPGASAYEEVRGISVYRHTGTRAVAGGRFVPRYLTALTRTARLATRIWRRNRFQVVQACNPPDLFFLIALLFRPFEVRFVFDQHDLCPEIFRDRFGRGMPGVHHALLLLERLSHAAADHVITVNDSCRDLLLSRTGTPPDRLTVVRTGPDVARLRRMPPVDALRGGRRYLCAYLGIMGPQDGVELVVRAAHVLVHELGRDDIAFVLMGDGDCLTDLVALTRQLEVEPWVTFTGFADDETISRYLSTSDLGLQPDQRTPFTDVCSMLKTVEYMAFGLPVVAFDLVETRRSAGMAAHYVAEETPRAFAEAIAELLDRNDERAAMSEYGLMQARGELAWNRQRATYLDVVRSTTRRRSAPSTPAPSSPTAARERLRVS